MSRKINVGIVGLGRAGRDMQRRELEKYPELFNIVAGCDHAPDRFDDLPAAFAGATLYDDYADMLADPAVELVAIATRHRHTRGAVTKEAWLRLSPRRVGRQRVDVAAINSATRA